MFEDTHGNNKKKHVIYQRNSPLKKSYDLFVTTTSYKADNWNNNKIWNSKQMRC